MLTQKIIENGLILSAELLSISGQLTQLRRLMRTRNRRGLSAINKTLNGAGNIAWITYFLSKGLYVPVVTNVIVLLIATVTLGFILSNKKQFMRGVVAIAIIGPITSFLIITHASIAGWIGVLYNVIAMTPWVVHILRSKRTSGISEHSLYIGLMGMVCTFTYSILIGSAPLLVGSIVGMSFTSVILRMYYRHRHK